MISFWMLSEFVIFRRFSGAVKNETAFGVMMSSISSVKFGRCLSKRNLFFYFCIATAAV